MLKACVVEPLRETRINVECGPVFGMMNGDIVSVIPVSNHKSNTVCEDIKQVFSIRSESESRMKLQFDLPLVVNDDAWRLAAATACHPLVVMSEYLVPVNDEYNYDTHIVGVHVSPRYYEFTYNASWVVNAITYQREAGATRNREFSPQQYVSRSIPIPQPILQPPIPQPINNIHYTTPDGQHMVIMRTQPKFKCKQ